MSPWRKDGRHTAGACSLEVTAIEGKDLEQAKMALMAESSSDLKAQDRDLALAQIGSQFAEYVRIYRLGLLQKTRRNNMARSKERDKEHGKGHVAMKTPPIVSQQEWEAADQQLLAKEKALAGRGQEVRVRRTQW